MPFNYEYSFITENGKRIFIPTQACRDKGQIHINKIERLWQPPLYFYHHRNGGHVAALRSHSRHTYFAKIDLANFFGSIGRNKIVRSMQGIGIGYTAALSIAEWATVRMTQGGPRVIPFGFVQSPLIASVVLDHSVAGKTLRKGLPTSVKRSVYVDDIILSSDDESELTIAYEALHDALRITNFTANTAKSHGSSVSTTAFNITASKRVMRITNDRIAKFTMAINEGYSDRTESILRYIQAVNHEQCEEVVASLREVAA